MDLKRTRAAGKGELSMSHYKLLIFFFPNAYINSTFLSSTAFILIHSKFYGMGKFRESSP